MTELLNTLYATTPGTSLHLDGDAVRIYHPDQTGRRLLPLVRIDHIVAFGGVTVTDDLMHRCAADARSVTWLSGTGRFLARLNGPQAATRTSGSPSTTTTATTASAAGSPPRSSPASFTTPASSCSAPPATQPAPGRKRCAPPRPTPPTPSLNCPQWTDWSR
jgi:CRISPR-associated protein Cas1